MSALTAGTVAGLLAWGTLAGMDLVSFPQALFSRPLIVGAGAGMIIGEPAVGLQMGLTMELFALDVLPVGASRYPDYGPGVVGAVVLASGGPTQLTVGVGTLFGLGLAVLGGLSLQLLRESNGAAIHRHAAGLAAGDATTMAWVQYRGLVSDLIRSLTLTAVAVGLAAVLRPRVPEGDRFALVSAVAIGCAVAAATGGAIRSAGRGARLRWLAVGAGLGLLLAVLR